MSKSQETAELYFQLSNNSYFENIAKLFTGSTIYRSQNTGLYVGKDEIIKMQKAFHGSFSSLNWVVNTVREISPSVIVLEYTFTATKFDGEQIKACGVEQIIVKGGRILHIEVQNK